MKRHGFTLIELMIVVIVISILASIVVVAYNGVQAEARDAKRRDGASKIAEAIELLYVQQGLSITDTDSNWGSGNGFVTSAEGKTICNEGSTSQNATGSGFIGKGSYGCTLDELLVRYGYLPDGYVLDLPKNPHYTTVDSGRLTYMTYRCSKSPGDYALFYALENPSQQDIASYDKVIADCGPGAAQRTSYGMQGAIYLDNLK